LVRHHGVPREAALGGVKSSLTEISRDLAAETDGHR